ncbi:GTP cyclohydrolase II isoform 1 [Hibiscus syriacus]|uniref:GTP cyclohydrolase II isoform 1 n=1 Tax=Hibiscus syriacus TaxID=106335 RepID=A0A6A3AVP5_HIBSY|nr:uncharacterized protein LOC120122590 [Hibiscus syriacus]KAE8706952.1 GTP cyclohydrolase II isoform 1 [Hibiscus syriacus]
MAANVKHKFNCSVAGKDNDVTMLGGLVSKKYGIDLMQNCDLPPPVKVFTRLDKAMELMSMNSRAVYNIMGREDDQDDDGFRGGSDGVGDDGTKLEIFKALRLSQTRAREAERKAAGLAEEKHHLSNAFMKDSLQLFAYRQWVRLLEIQVWVLKSQMVDKEKKRCDKTEGESLEEESENNGDKMSWKFVFGSVSLLGLSNPILERASLSALNFHDNSILTEMQRHAKK